MWIWKRRAGVLWSITLIAALAVAVYLLPRSLAGQLEGSSARAAVVVIVLAILALGLVGHVIHCFTRNLPPLEAKLSRELRSLFLYAYIFQGLMIVVPLYVVVLAIIGGAVGMTRRLPELQRRAAHSYLEERRGNDPPTISPTRAREQIVFQIMQVFAAPLIAIVAFSALEPDTVTAAVLIGFASGFSSEPILMKLRSASEAVAGVPASRAGNNTPPKPQEES